MYMCVYEFNYTYNIYVCTNVYQNSETCYEYISWVLNWSFYKSLIMWLILSNGFE